MWNGKARSRCKVCRNSANRAYNQAHWQRLSELGKKYRLNPNYKARKNARSREKYANDPDYAQKIRTRNQKKSYENSLRRRYGITLDHYLTMLDEQLGLCKICKCDLTALGTRLDGVSYIRAHVDHCHKTGVVRGLLCTECNVGLGKFGDDTALLKAAIMYLESTSGELPRREPSAQL